MSCEWRTDNDRNRQRQEQTTTGTDNDKNRQRQKKKQIPPLRCGMTDKRTGNSKMRGFFAALRMTAGTGDGKNQYGDSGCARMTTRGAAIKMTTRGGDAPE
jgi:hypothetical protein